MAQQNDPIYTHLLQLFTDNAPAAFAEGLRILVNETMLQERSAALGATPYQRSNERKGYANGFNPKTMATKHGQIRFDIPRVRGEGVSFYPWALDKTSAEKGGRLEWH